VIDATYDTVPATDFCAETRAQPPILAAAAEDEGKDPAAVALGRRGGAARAAALGKRKSAEIARKAAAARWKSPSLLDRSMSMAGVASLASHLRTSEISGSIGKLSGRVAPSFFVVARMPYLFLT
jgi:hypothetical protein